MEHLETEQAPPKAERERLFDEGMTAYKAKEYETALPLLTQAAELGHATAQFRCGWMYSNGEGTEADPVKALSWYEKAAEQDHKAAQYNCGLQYYKGRGTEEDKAKALSWYEKAAEQGHAKAQFRCGWMYSNGEGTEADPVKALSWYEKAAEQGHQAAQYNCGLAYGNGKGTAADQAKALYWYEKAAEQGYAKAQFLCGQRYKEGKGTEADLDKARYWFGKAAEQGEERAKAALEELQQPSAPPPAPAVETPAPKEEPHAPAEEPPAPKEEPPVEELSAAMAKPAGPGTKGILKIASTLVILLAGWIVMSRCGFLPLALSFPGKLTRQAYGSPYKITGYGFENQILRMKYTGKYALVPAGTFRSLGVLNNANISGRYAFYNSEEDAFYILVRSKIYRYEVDGKNELKTVWKGLDGSVNSITGFDNLFIEFSNKYGLQLKGKYGYEGVTDRNIEDDYRISCYTYSEDEQGNKVRSVDYNYRTITELLQKNETEAISLDDLTALLYVARYNVLEGWYPESGTAVFRDWEDDSATFITYTLGEEDVRRYGPYDLSGCSLISISETDCYLHDSNSQAIYRWNFITQEKTKIMDTPPLSQVCMNLQPDGGLFFAGIQEDDNLFLYSTAYKDPGELEIKKNYYNHLAIGDNCVLFWSTAEFTNEVSYYHCWYLREDA